MKNKPTRVVALIWAAVMIAAVSSTLTLLLTGARSGEHWVSEREYEAVQRYRRLDEVRDILMTQYYQPLDEETLLTGAIRGMTKAVGDVYTFYYTPEEMQRESEDEQGRYRGIGVLIERSADGYIEVVRVYPDSPAELAGLKVGDLIYSVDGKLVGGLRGKNYEDGVKLIRGEENTTVRLGILRGKETFETDVMRADVNISYASYQLLGDDVGYVSVSQFSGDAADRFDEALGYFKGHNARGMIIDLRNNPGGFLTEVNRIADRILPKGIIVYIQDRDGVRTDYYSDADMYDIPMVVLVNRMSASASEILAASVQALDRGKVVGVTTYGKGIVQTLKTFDSDGAGMQYTTSSYYDAQGRSINGVGVTPDVEVALEGDRVPMDPDPESDNQLAKALEVLREEMREREG
ncbi:MAG: S41 family peptidase [Clostridia bacterium]|nr:S41 family peptidase [Clostridia bacterium]